MAYQACTKRQKDILATANELFGARSQLASFWQECADHFYPERGTFTREFSLGEDYGRHLMESYPVLARRELANAFASMLRPRGQDWFAPQAARESARDVPAVKDFSETVQKKLYRAIYDPKSKFVRATSEADHDYATFGNAVLSCERRKDGDGLIFHAWHLRDCVWMEDADRSVNWLARRFKLTARAALNKFGDKLHEDTKRLAREKPASKVEFMHIIVPSPEYGEMDLMGLKKDDMDGAGARPFVSLVIECGQQCLMEGKGIARFPYVVPRWALLSDSQYALSPCVTTGLVDARLVQRQALTILEAGEKAVDPPMAATREAVVGGVNLMAGGVTWIDAEYDERLGSALRPIELGKNVTLGLDMKQDTRELLQQAFYLNALNLPDTREMTAYEARQRVQEYVRAALPIFEPIEVDYSAPLLDLALGILLDMGVMGRRDEWPEELQTGKLTFAFSNPLQEAIETQKAAKFSDGMALVANAAGTDPEAVRVPKVSVALRGALEGIGWPQEWLSNKDEAKAADEVSDTKAGVRDVAEMAQMAGSAAGAVGMGGGGLLDLAGQLGGGVVPPELMPG